MFGYLLSHKEWIILGLYDKLWYSNTIDFGTAAGLFVVIICILKTKNGCNDQIFHIHNVGSQNIIITDSTTSKIASTFTMGNSDSITLLGVGSNCVELARANN